MISVKTNEWKDSKLDFTNMLAKGGWEEDENQEI